MPIVLDDSILVPPSLRRGPPPRVYNMVQPGTTTTTIIEAGASHIPHRPLTPPRSPVIIHQETTSYIPREGSLDEFQGEVEYVTPGTRRRVYIGSDPGRSRYRSHSIGASYEGGFEVSRPRRSYDDDKEYYLEDGSRHGSYAADIEYSHRHHGHEDYPRPYESERHHHHHHHHHRRHLAEAGLAAGALGAKEIHDHRERRRVDDGYHSDSSDEGHGHHRGRKVAATALGATAAGLAAHQIYKRRHRSRSRSSGAYTSSSDTDHHTGRKVAGAALGATAASIAAHKIHQHHQKSRHGSRSSSSDREHPHHRKAKLAAATIGTGLAARHIYHRREARSKSSSRSRSREREPWGRHIAAAALGATAAGLAHHEYKHHHQPERPRPVLRRSFSDGGFRGRRNSIFSRHRSPSPHKHSKLKKAAATAVAAAVAKKALDHYREGRSRSRSSSRSPKHHHGIFHRGHSPSRSRSRSRHRVGVPEAVAATMIGAGIAGERAHRKHKEKKREKEMYGRGVAVPDGESHPMYHGSSPPYAHPGGSLNGGGYAETIDSDSSMPRNNTPPLRSNSPPAQDRNRSRRGSLSARLVDGLMDHLAGSPDQRRTLGDGLSPDAIAYRLGQTIGEHTSKKD